jgi:hypothetical protein
MRSDSEFQVFLQKWRDALRTPSLVWDGYRAVADLKSARYTRSSPDENARRSTFDFVRCQPGYGPRCWEMLEGIVAEVEDYKKHKLAWKKERRDAELLLAGVERRIKLRQLKVVEPSLRSLLATVAEVIEQQRLALRSSMTPTRHSPLGVWERVWQGHERSKDITRGIDLDTRLQVQSAKMLRTFLHRDEGVSLRTIARLVVLVYLAAGLATKKRNQARPRLWIAESARTVTWRMIEEKLNARGIR